MLIGGGAELSNLTLIDHLCQTVDNAFLAGPTMAARFPNAPAASGQSAASLKSYVKDMPGHDRRYTIDATKALEALRYSPAYTLEEGFAAMLRWYLSHKTCWRALLEKAQGAALSSKRAG